MRLSKNLALILATGYTVLITALLCWASASASVFALPKTLTGAPWFITTCADAWMGLFIITLWSWCFESTWPKRLLWFVLIMGLGNVGVGLFLIKRVRKMPHHFTLQDFFTRNMNQKNQRFEKKEV